MSGEGARALRIVRSQRPGGTVVRLSGTIDERLDIADFGELGETIVFDLDQVELITSSGVKQWMRALKRLPTPAYYFIRCRPQMVVQFNLVRNFGGIGQLVSFYAPYACDACDVQLDLLIDLRFQHEAISAYLAPSVSCPSCKAPMELDEQPEWYFQFAASHTPTVTPDAEALIDGGRRALDASLKVEKEISRNVLALKLSGPLDARARLKRIAQGLEGTILVLMHDVTEVNEEGVLRLAEMCEETLGGAWVASAPPEAVTALAANPQALRVAKVISVRLPCRCASCGRESFIDAEQDQIAGLTTGGEVRTCCSECLAPLTTTVDAALVEAARKVVTCAPPAEVRSWLEAHGEAVAPRRSPTPVPSPGSASTPFMIGKYQLLERIGTGGFAVVYLARQLGPVKFEKRVVLKRIHKHLCVHPELTEMLLHEARLAAQISHPNVVQILDLGRVGSEFYIVMEYVRGWDFAAVLQKLRQQGATVPLAFACQLVRDVAAGLAAAHEFVDERGRLAPLVHRDVSPHNVLLAVDGTVKLTDFGIARAVDSASKTEAGMLKGKILYMAPERISGHAVADPRLDIYALGLVMHEAIAGEHPYLREDPFASMRAILNEPLPRLTTYWRDAPAEAQAIIDRATARSPEDRYPSAMAMREDVEQLLGRFGSSTLQFRDWLRGLFPGDRRLS